MESSGKPLILVVDDNLTIRNLVATILSAHNMEVVSVADGDEALAYLEKRRPDVVLLDLAMPRVDGLEVLRQVRAHPTLYDIRIVMLTAVANTARFKEVHAYKPDGYLEKPFRINDLIDQVKQALRGNQR
ncbi:MAG TPA: response regulator [Anaerolineae bacterium]|nr:response regulator [Anaerolineae bacterium]